MLAAMRPLANLLLRAVRRLGPTEVGGLVAGVLLLAAALRGGEAWLARQAADQARAGASRAVAATRRDWVRHVVPVALEDPGPAGEEARGVVAAAVDVAVARARGGETAPLAKLAPQLLDALRVVPSDLSEEGARWGAWLARRLAETAELVPSAARARLLVRADATLALLARAPRQRLPTPPPQPPPADVPETAQPLPAARAVAPAEPTERGLASTPPPAPVDEPAPAGKPRPLADAWRSPPTRLPANPPEELPPPDPSPAAVADLADLELIAEALRLREALPRASDGPSAVGPAGVPAIDGVRHPLAERFEVVGRELRRRGFARVSGDQAAALVSPDPAARRGLAERCLTDPTGDPGRVLLTLAKDSDPRVRVAALTALGSSPSRAMVEAALEAAVADTDPRVGRLAETLRERLR